MLTLSGAPVGPPVRDDRPAYRPFRARVARVDRLAPHFRRVTLRGEDLAVLGTDGLDQRIKLVLPLPDGRLCDLGADDPAHGTWYATWQALPDAERNPLRTFTIREARPWSRQLDVVVVDHGADGAGPAARWLAGAAAGDPVLVVGPDARSRHSATGIDFHPGEATDVLLAGDETAAPAICAILEALPHPVRASALVEVPDAGDVLPLGTRHADITWLARGREGLGAPLHRAVRAWLAARPALVRDAAAGRPQPLPHVDVDRRLLWEAPERAAGNGLYAWVAGEAGVVRALRRCLVSEHGVDRRRVAFMGYWRLGQAERA